MQAMLNTFSAGPPDARPHLLITGGIHGDEFEPIVAVRRLVERFADGTPTAGELRGRLTCVPIANRPAFLRGHRCGDDGLDLARTFPGRSDGSTTEQIAWQLSCLIRQADYYIDLHTGGTELRVAPLSGYMLHRSAEILAVQRRMACAFGLPIVWGSSPDLDGRSLSLARDAGVPAIYCEYEGGARYDPRGAAAYEEGCLNVMAELQMIGPRSRAAPPQYHVEDGSPRSGHMQICNPAPVDGFFAAACELGRPIETGDLLGEVCPVDGGRPLPMIAREAGLLIVQRSFPRVRQGDSVGVVMPLSRTLREEP